MEKIDPRYKRGKIYTIRCRYDDNLIYVGSTIQTLSNRLSGHRRDKKCSLYQYVNGDWDNWYIELYEEHPCNNKEVLEKREGRVIREIGNINKFVAGRTLKEYRQENRDILAEQRKKYYQDNRDKIILKNNEWCEANRDKVAEKNKEWRQNNRDKLKQKRKVYRQDNRDELLEKSREKITCDNCGCFISRGGIARHKKSKKCLNFNVGNN